MAQRRTVIATGLAAVAAVASRPALAQVDDGTKNKVVFQISDPEPARWNLALNNVRNFQTELPDDVSDIEVVVYGPGIALLRKESTLAQRVADTLKNGVKVVACENTMHAMKLEYKDMLPDIGYVKAGVVELVKKQQQGYAYIRP